METVIIHHVFCLFFQNEEFEFNIYNLVLYFFKHAPANQDTCTNYAMGLKVSIEKSSMLYML